MTSGSSVFSCSTICEREEKQTFFIIALTSATFKKKYLYMAKIHDRLEFLNSKSYFLESSKIIYNIIQLVKHTQDIYTKGLSFL
jgi:hypothetical protein